MGTGKDLIKYFSKMWKELSFFCLKKLINSLKESSAFTDLTILSLHASKPVVFALLTILSSTINQLSQFYAFTD
jgi:hypothetical protein